LQSSSTLLQVSVVGVPGAAGGFAALGLVALAAGIPALRRRRR
jgi:hypothetical protein